MRGISPHRFILSCHPGVGRRRSLTAEGWSSRASVFSCRVIATGLACRGLPTSCRRPGHFLLLAQEKVTKEKGPPDDAPSGLRPPGARVGCGVFRQGILPWRKTGPHPCGPPFGLSSTHPPRHTGTPESQEPRAKSRSRSRELRIYCRSAPCARPSYGAIHPGVAVAHRVRSYRKAQTFPRAPAPHPDPLPAGERRSAVHRGPFVGAHLCATSRQSDTSPL